MNHSSLIINFSGLDSSISVFYFFCVCVCLVKDGWISIP